MHFARSRALVTRSTTRFVSFLQRLGYLVFLQVLLLPCLAYSTFHVSLGHNFRFSFASFCYCCSYTYFILVRPFCYALFVFHSAPGADFVWNEIFLFVSVVRDRSSPGAGFLSEKIVWGIGGFLGTSSPPCWWTVNKRSLISSFCLSTSICSFHHCYLCLQRLHENHLYGPGPFGSGTRVFV